MQAGREIGQPFPRDFDEGRIFLERQGKVGGRADAMIEPRDGVAHLEKTGMKKRLAANQLDLPRAGKRLKQGKDSLNRLIRAMLPMFADVGFLAAVRALIIAGRRNFPFH